MKKLLTIALTLVSGVALAEVNAPMSNEIGADGTIKRRDKVFLNVRMTDGDAARGQVLVWDTTEDDGVSVETTTTLGAQHVACVADEAIASGSQGRCQVRGYFDAVEFDADPGSATAGEFVYASSTAGDASGTTHAADVFPIGVALDSSSTSGTLEVYLKIQ